MHIHRPMLMTLVFLGLGASAGLGASGDGDRQLYVAWRNLYGVFALAGMLREDRFL